MSNLIIKRPHITEKAVAMSHQNHYIFVIENKANTSEVKKAIKDLYSVDVVKVNIISVPPKRKRYKNRFFKTGGYKKAIIKLKPGQTIDIIPQ